MYYTMIYIHGALGDLRLNEGDFEVMNDKIIITTFTDPMMGLSWEYEPTFRKLEAHFRDIIEFRYIMSVLVPNVYRLVDSKDMRISNEFALKKYNERLAKIYESEEAISGMPINMNDFHLFSVENTSSRPLNLAYKAVQLLDKNKAGLFLYNLRYATVFECRQTTKLEEILNVVKKTDIDCEKFLEFYNNGIAENALNHDLILTKELGIYTLPAYLIQHNGKNALIRILIEYESFVSVIKDISNGKILPQNPELNVETFSEFLNKHPLISLLELKEAFDFEDTDGVKKFLSQIPSEKYVLKDDFIKFLP